MTIAMPWALQYSTLSLSRMEPPGWMTALMPALSAISTQSENGKNASEAITAPSSENPKLCAFSMACFSASTLDVCPMPLAIMPVALGQNDGIGLGVLDYYVGEKHVVDLLAGRFCNRDGLQVCGRFLERVPVLYQNSSQHRPELDGRGAGRSVAQYYAVLFAFKYFQCFRGVVGSYYHFEEYLVHLLGCLFVYRPV